ncbi:MAG: putative toxin-antitoxin system toxin component, PIN family [Eubacteriales bacterium]|nr:putative toxin-antitoxin system toxin component, PIN family [Eubacteriales bacterium]
MKIMLDTNVLIFAFVFGGKAGKLMVQLIDSEHELYVSEYVNQEFKGKLQMKWPDKAEKVYKIYRTMNFHFCDSTNEKLEELRDVKDISVLSDALHHHIDFDRRQRFFRC